MKDLIEILTWSRGAGTESESRFVREHIATIEGIWPDEYGNYHLTIGPDPKILWSCHTDTVTKKEGRQNVKWVGKGILGLHNGKPGMCLGADDGGGVWIMLELIKNKRPGHYVFHRDEEIGGLGSSWISKNAYVLPTGLECAIAMDRAGTRDIITHQMYMRTCSDEFASSMAKMLPDGMIHDDTGVFTDTANYTELIGECTNLSIGYERNHGPSETLDTNHIQRLRDKLVELDQDKLVFRRQPGEMEYGGCSGVNYYGGRANSAPWDPTCTSGRSSPTSFDYDPYEDYDDMPISRDPTDDGKMAYPEMVECAPSIAARLLSELGVTREEFRAHVFALENRILGS